MQSISLTPDEVRHLGLVLNAGQVIGWKERVAALLDTLPPTVASWALPKTSTAMRNPSGTSIRLLLMVKVLHDRGELTPCSGTSTRRRCGSPRRVAGWSGPAAARRRPLVPVGAPPRVDLAGPYAGPLVPVYRLPT